jgi:glycosyltransferase involved in cell wall biosynthesis
VRLLTVTSLFPNACEPRLGIFVANRLRKICDTGRVTARVIAPVPWFPGAYRSKRCISARETLMGFDVAHPRYLNVPAIGMRWQPRLLANALVKHLERDRVDGHSFDVVDAHYFYPDGVAAAHVARMLELPLVISARGSDINLIGDVAFARSRMLEVARQAEALIAVSSALADRMAALGMPSERIHVLRNGVDTALFHPMERAHARSELALPDGPLVLGVGNLVPEKRFDLLIHAIAGLPHARLLIVGEGRLRGYLGALAARVAPARVMFHANMAQSQLRMAYAASNVLGLPSAREGWPNVLLESIACGTPVVAAGVGGVPEMLRPGAPGIIVDGADVVQWRTALDALVRKDMAPDDVRRYAFAFDWEEIVTRQCNLYDGVVLAGGAMRARPALTGIS